MSDAAMTGSSLNEQVTDAVEQVTQAVLGAKQPLATAAAFQMISHSLSLAVQNAVAQQQHSYMLRNALTTAAAKAMLAGQTTEAEAVLKLAESPLVNPNFAQDIGQFREAIELLQDALTPPTSPQPTSGKAAT